MARSECTVEGITSTKSIRLKRLLAEEAPDSYVSHTEHESKIKGLVDKFQSDLLQSSPHLKERLLLLPQNEFGTEKFVCSFIQPTLLPYTELYDVRSCAEYLSRYAVYEPYEPPADGSGIPIISPGQTLDWAVGDCFDLSFLLSSLLIGAGYDAFVVYGRAPEWIRRKDMSHMKCSLEQRDDDMSRPMDLQVIIKDERYKEKPVDGDDIHCWVLVKPGRRIDLDGPHFVEPSTGILYPATSSPYTQVFSIWNDRNCWLSMIDIGDTLVQHGEEEFDFSNSDMWAPVLSDTHSLPSSWVKALDLPKEQFLLRYPTNGKRVINLDRAKLELFGDKIGSEGLKSRVTRYEDIEQTMAVEYAELFCPTQRPDYMIQRIRKPQENMYQEYFSYKNDMCERKEVVDEGKRVRCVKYRQKTRADGLIEREEKIDETCTLTGQETGYIITEKFINRSDGLQRRIVHISFLPKDAKKPKSSEVFPGTSGMALAVISQIEEHFQAPADTSKLETSVAQRTFLLKDGSVSVTFHCEHEVLRRVEKYSKQDMAGDNPLVKELIQLQNASISAVKRTQTEMIKLIKTKTEEEMEIMGTSSPSSHEAEGKHALSSSLSGTKASEENYNKGEVEVDYLSPYLLQFGTDKGTLSKEDAIVVRDT